MDYSDFRNCDQAIARNSVSVTWDLSTTNTKTVTTLLTVPMNSFVSFQSAKEVNFHLRLLTSSYLSCWNIGYGWPRGYSSAKGTYYSAVLCNGSREGPVPPWLHLLYIDVLSLMARRSMDIQYSSTGFIDAQKREISPVLKHQSHGSPQGKCVSVRWWIKRSCGSWGELTPSGA